MVSEIPGFSLAKKGGGKISREPLFANQYAKVTNGTGYVGAGDIEDLKTRLNEIWAMTKAVMKRLAAII